MKLITIIGARPQFIKAAPFSEEFRQHHQEVLIHTGQHYDPNMSEVFFAELNIPKPTYHLEIGSGHHGAQTGRMLEKIENVLLKESCDGVLVYGDTNSTFAGALAASKLHIPVFHVEAGLRSYNKRMPEEQNRVLTDHLSDLLLCPTKTATDNLLKEGIVKGVVLTGDIMYDAVLRNREISERQFKDGSWARMLIGTFGAILPLTENEYYLATIHRAENTDSPEKLLSIFKAFENADKPVLLPLHPRTRKIAEKLNIRLMNTQVVEPVGYLLMLYLTANAYMVITDSGGLQKEAYFLKTPCTTLREQTEWTETLEDGWNRLCEIRSEAILEAIHREHTFQNANQPELFGDGHAARKICETIISRGNGK
jgi:UDP-GlcNAc3NAcA epimerase